MKITLLIISSALVGIVISACFILGFMSRTGKAPGLDNGKLTRCPHSPNCVCSERVYNQQKSNGIHYIEPIPIPPGIEMNSALTIMRDTIQTLRGSVVSITDIYLAATFRSAVFGFVDDLEIRIDPGQRIIHIRSASRVGYSDMGINRRRAQQVKDRFIENLRR